MLPPVALVYDRPRVPTAETTNNPEYLIRIGPALVLDPKSVATAVWLNATTNPAALDISSNQYVVLVSVPLNVNRVVLAPVVVVIVY